MQVRLAIPQRRGREAQEAIIAVEGDLVIEATAGLHFMRGWRSQTLRAFCKDVGWSATVARGTDAARD